MALSAVRVDADESLRSLDPYSHQNISERNCFFEDETSSLKFHKRYSQANCFLECYLSNAQSQLKIVNKTYKSCTPWYFPFSSINNSVICDPWEAKNISQWIQVQSAGPGCSRCLPGEAILNAFSFCLFY